MSWSDVLDAGYRRVLRPRLFSAASGDPEGVHEQTLALLERASGQPALLAALRLACLGPRRPVTVAGIVFPALVGLAAGMDKNGVAPRAWAALGFGHVELGTVTAQAQPGNPRPRVFRLRETGGLVNRMGFNNAGAAALSARLEADGVRRGNGAVGVPLGISIGKTKTTPLPEATQDYLTSFETLAPYADYVAVNVSSPNTPGLRTLQESDSLRALVQALTSAAARTNPGRPVPVFVKVAPDLTEEALEEVLAVCESAGASGLVATNTTLSRAGIAPTDHWKAGEAGGLSGAPLTVRAREVVSFLSARTSLPVIGVGGILTPDDGRAMLDAGAALLQVYTGYIYGGPALVRRLNALALPEPRGRATLPGRRDHPRRAA